MYLSLESPNSRMPLVPLLLRTYLHLACLIGTTGVNELLEFIALSFKWEKKNKNKSTHTKK